MPKVNLKKVVREACLLEGGAEQVNIAQASDILKSALDVMADTYTLAEIVAFFEERKICR